MCFTLFQNEKTTFQALKTRSSKSREIEIFSNGLTHGFGQKTAIFPFFFKAMQASKMCFTIFQNEKTAFQAIKKRSSRSQDIEISPNELTHGFRQKMDIFSPFFLRKYKPGKCVLRCFLKEKTLFQAIKTRSLKSRKIEIFLKGLTSGFNQQMAIYPCFFLQAIQARKMFYDILGRKTPFQAIKTRS